MEKTVDPIQIYVEKGRKKGDFADKKVGVCRLGSRSVHRKNSPIKGENFNVIRREKSQKIVSSFEGEGKGTKVEEENYETSYESYSNELDFLELYNISKYIDNKKANYL